MRNTASPQRAQRDPYAVLGLRHGASPAQARAAYRRKAKRLHPDRQGDTHAMAELNAAYDLLRAAALEATRRQSQSQSQSQSRKAPEQRAPARNRRRTPVAPWIQGPTRSALGYELLAALRPEEPVEYVTPVGTWGSGRTILAVTDRRLLWLLDDAVMGRVRSLPYRDVKEAASRRTFPLRRRAALRVSTRNGRHYGFADLHPAVAEWIADRIMHAARSAA